MYPLSGNPLTISVRSRPVSLLYRVEAATAALFITLVSGNKEISSEASALAYVRIRMCGKRLARFVRAMRGPPSAG
jgi:hypothetical protein